MTKTEQLKTNLYNLLKNDYTIEHWNENNYSITFSFFHLSDCYNALIHYIPSEKTFSISWGYVTPTKKAEKLLKKLFQSFDGLKIDYILREVDYYRALAKQLFKCKYDLDIYLHTIND